MNDTHQAWAFAQVDAFLDRCRPLTPWGRDEREARTVLDDPVELESRFDDTACVLRFLTEQAEDGIRLDKLAWHLKRMPRLPLASKDEYEIIELFQVKKFLANYRGAASCLDPELSERFGLSPDFSSLGADGPACATLAAELDRGGSDMETFYLADSYDPELGELRAALNRADAALRADREAYERSAEADHDLSFDGREFVVAPVDIARPLAAEPARYSLEPYDESRYVVRLLPSARALSLLEERERLGQRERELENRVIRRLSAMAAAALPGLKAAVTAITRLDRARTAAVLARDASLRRPVIDAVDSSMKEARFVPCEEECRSLGLAYTPLTASFQSGAIVLFGSNMGGKTVVLKTVLFFQLLAQAGYFVPAKEYRTRVYRGVEYVGEQSGERLAGLSGFGFEIHRFEKVWRGTEDVLVAFDELARTTSSHEAEALLSAIVEAYATGRIAGGQSSGPSRAFFATHFRGIARIPGAEYLRMRGLDRDAALECLDADTPLSERLAGINRHMRYEIVPDDPTDDAESDALAIAAMLGLDPRLTMKARRYLADTGTRP